MIVIQVYIPGRELNLQLKYLLLDANGTLTLDGCLIPGVAARIAKLKDELEIYILTSDTQGRATQVAEDLGVAFFKVGSQSGGPDKRDFLNTLGPEYAAAIGNGYNDRLMLKQAALSIAVLGPEGASLEALRMADIAVGNILDGLDLLLNPLRLIATLRD